MPEHPSIVELVESESGASTTRHGTRLEQLEFARIARGTMHPYLLIVAGPQAGRTIRVEDGLVIGRSSACGLHLDEQGVSRKHARLERMSDGNVVVIDLGSTNGTLVNGAFCKRRTLQDGDVIVVGDASVLKFSFADLLEEKLIHSLYQSARRDPLTGLNNRRWFDDTLPLEVERAGRRGRPLSLMMVDVDRLEAVNDAHGNLAGDQVLCSVASVISATIRRQDSIARFAGEEIVALLRDTELEAARGLAERVRAAVEGTRVVHESAEIGVTVSIGLATMNRPMTGGGMVAAANRCVHGAKAGGRNRIQYVFLR